MTAGSAILSRCAIVIVSVANARSQLTLLVRKLKAICHIVQPSTKTLDAYGHEIRNLLILAATEVEMHWRAVLADDLIKPLDQVSDGGCGRADTREPG